MTAPPATSTSRPGKSPGSLVRGAGTRVWDASASYTGVLVSLVILVVVLGLTQDSFLTAANLFNILETNAVLLIVSVGLTFVVLQGGFDLSIGGLLALSAVAMAAMVTVGVPIIVAILAVVVGGGAIGALANGVPIARFGMSFFVVTLATASVFRSIALVVTGRATQNLYDQPFLRAIGTGRLWGVPWPAIICLSVLVIGWVVLRYTGLGRLIYAVGGGPEAARLAGVDVVLVRVAAFGIAGALVGLAAVVEVGRLAGASPSQGTAIELTAAAAVLLGGTSFSGGSGSLVGTFLGVAFLGVLSNGLSLAGISAFWQGAVSGGVLFIAVAIDRVRSSRGST